MFSKRSPRLGGLFWCFPPPDLSPGLRYCHCSPSIDIMSSPPPLAIFSPPLPGVCTPLFFEPGLRCCQPHHLLGWAPWRTLRVHGKRSARRKISLFFSIQRLSSASATSLPFVDLLRRWCCRTTQYLLGENCVAAADNDEVDWRATSGCAGRLRSL
ncbi:hypothetical protein BD626DRAFT_501823 [Schizophyllum amplum]|uniref:Uncharacterized protein n=1 Tax=Schizophyllum amplum TaxID=97359 RepID=A0A550C8T7_9AGAR|nr:hypothetical protein BD626DRAFT_501823 [Auriculariopsis ampla]